MASLDIFNNDAFSLIRLSATMLDVPAQPMRLSGLFDEEGITTLSVAIERQGDTLKLIPARVRGAPGEPVHLGPRQLISIPTIHLPQVGAILADEVQGIRAFGSETEVDQALSVFKRKLRVARQRMDLTMAYQRIGALKGIVLDYDGTTPLYNLYTEFGKSQQSFSFDLDDANTVVRDKIVALKRLIEAAAGGLDFGGIEIPCSSEFFDALTAHASVKTAWERWKDGEYLREDHRNKFTMAGVTFLEFTGSVNSIRFMEAGYGYAYPLGITGMFKTYFAPADYMETVNTTGLPYYVKQERMKMDRGIEFETQSNPLNLNTRPELVIRIATTDALAAA